MGSPFPEVAPERPVTVEVLAYAPVAFFHCQHCELVWQQAGTANFHRDQISSSLPEDLRQQYQGLSDWIRKVSDTYGTRVVFRVIDAASIEGWFKSLRYGIHKYPAVIVDRKEKFIGGDFDPASDLIRERVERLAPVA